MQARIHHSAQRNIARERIVDRAVKLAEARKVRPTKKEQKR